MKNRFIKITLALFTALAAVSCGDPNDAFDMRSPQARIECDSLEVERGSVITLEAILTDESGVASYKVSYDAWEVNRVKSLADEAFPQTYHFSETITVPDDALLEWKENYQKHDGSIFNITQTYHKLALTFYDTERNSNTVYFYVKVKE